VGEIYIYFGETDQAGQTILLLTNQKQSAYRCQEKQTPSKLKQEKKILLFGLVHVPNHCLTDVYEREKNCSELTKDMMSLIK